MVIQTNEQEFKGKTLQEYLEWKYPTQEDKEGVKEIDIWNINNDRKDAGITEKKKNWEGKEVDEAIKLEGGELDLRKFKNLERVGKVSRFFLKTGLTKLNIDGLVNLTEL